MKKFAFFAAAISLLILSSTFTFAQSGYYVVTNNDPSGAPNSATIFQLKNKGLDIFKTLDTGANGGGGGDFDLPRIILNKTGSSECLFVGDAGASDVAAFRLPGLAKVGNYKDPDGNSDGFGYSLGLAARGNFLFAAYGVSANIGVFEISSNCSLSLVGTYNAATSPAGLRVTPDGNTLVVGYGYGTNLVDTFSVSSKGALTENGLILQSAERQAWMSRKMANTRFSATPPAVQLRLKSSPSIQTGASEPKPASAATAAWARDKIPAACGSARTGSFFS